MKRNSISRRTVTVDLENGLHLVPCSLIAQTARRFQGDVRIQKDDLSVDAKNVLELMTLNAEQGTSLMLEARGEGAAELIDELARLFESGFQGENESGE